MKTFLVTLMAFALAMPAASVLADEYETAATTDESTSTGSAPSSFGEDAGASRTVTKNKKKRNKKARSKKKGSRGKKKRKSEAPPAAEVPPSDAGAPPADAGAPAQ